MTDIFNVLNDSEILERIQNVNLTQREKRNYRNFVKKFSGARFYYNKENFLAEYQMEENVELPIWFLVHLTTLAGAFPAEGSLSYQFDSFMKGSRSPLADDVERQCFKINLTGWPSGKAQKEALKNAGKTLSLFPIGVSLDDEGYQLAINLKNKRDKSIYLFHLDDIGSIIAEGGDISTMTFKIFSSPSAMLSFVKAIEHGGKLTLANSRS